MPQRPPFEDPVFSAFRGGDASALAEVRGWITQVVSHPAWRLADVESVVQDVLLKLLDIARSGAFQQRSSFRTFTISVARHTCIDAYRRQRWREQTEVRLAPTAAKVAAEGEPEAQHYAREQRDALCYIYQKLPEECRRLWLLIYGQGLAARQVAERLGISEENVRVRVHRCLQKARVIADNFLGQEI